MLTMEGLIAVLALCGTCFGIGYTIFHQNPPIASPCGVAALLPLALNPGTAMRISRGY